MKTEDKNLVIRFYAHNVSSIYRSNEGPLS